MKPLIKISFCVALLLNILQCEVRGVPLSETLSDLAKNDRSIENIFKPYTNGFLGKGTSAIAYKGKLLLNGMEVAMKFTPYNKRSSAEREYKIYTYLNAIDNRTIEWYGIPSIHYYGRWNNFIMMAMNLFDSEFHKRTKRGTITELDLLILFQEFVRVTKYIHARGVSHNDLKLDNMVFRGSQGFIIDYGCASDMYAYNQAHYARGDWVEFLHTTYDFIKPRLEWLEFSAVDQMQIKDADSFVAKLIENVGEIEDSHFTGIRRVFVEFTKHAHNMGRKSRTPFYDQLYEVIHEEIQGYGYHVPAVFSWLTYDDLNETISIADITGTFGLVEPHYDEVNWSYFTEKYSEQLNCETSTISEQASSSSSGKSSSSRWRLWGKS